jgi:hypothetical protein
MLRNAAAAYDTSEKTMKACDERYSDLMRMHGMAEGRRRLWDLATHGSCF